MPAEHVWFSVEEAADYLRVSKRTIYRWVRDGLLPGYRAGPHGPWRFRREDLDGVMRKAGSEEAAEGLTVPAEGKESGDER